MAHISNRTSLLNTVSYGHRGHTVLDAAMELALYAAKRDPAPLRRSHTCSTSSFY
jgi:hypothetical protein